MDPESNKGHQLVDVFEAFLEFVATWARFNWKTPPHDIAVWIVKEIIRRHLPK